jgi:hypothetical protein
VLVEASHVFGVQRATIKDRRRGLCDMAPRQSQHCTQVMGH